MLEDAVTITPEFIHMCVDERDYQKGKAYEKQGRVISATYKKDGNGGFFFGEVRGSLPLPYAVEVTVVQRRYAMPSLTSCSCMLGGSCKHVAALLLSVMKQQTITVVPEMPAWQTLLTNIIRSDQADRKGQEVALLFEVREHQVSSGPYWKPVKTTAHFCSIKPAVRNTVTNKWVKSGISWKDVKNEQSYPTGRYRLSHQQIGVLADFFNAYRGSRTDREYDETLIRLDVFSNAGLWALLDNLRSAGIACITPARGNPAVFFHEPVTIQATARDIRHDLELSVRLMSGDVPVPKLNRHFIGEPISGVYWWKKAGYLSLLQVELHIAPLRTSQTLLALAQSGVAITVPEKDVDTFAESIYPKLARRLPIDISHVRHVSLKQAIPVRAMVAVSSHGDHELRAHIGFAYDDAGKNVVPYGVPYVGDIERDEAEEARVLGVLQTSLQGNGEYWFDMNDDRPILKSAVTLQGTAAIFCTQNTIPLLRANKDILVSVAPDVPTYSELAGVPEIRYELRADDGQPDWFNLGIEIIMEGTKLPFEQVFTALAEGEETLLLENGNYLRLHHPELNKLRQLIAEARALNDKEPDAELGLSRFQAGLWEELQALGVVTQQAAAWDTAVKGLLNVKNIPDIPIPKKLKTKLRPYQREGFQWMVFLWNHRLGGILADDMGLGKTVQTIALLLHIIERLPAKQRKPILVIAPTSVVANWADELSHLSPTIRYQYIQKVTGGTKELLQKISKADVVLTSYGLFRLDAAAYNAQQWELLILDEAQFVKNYQSQAYQHARKLNATLKLALTGTPLENNLMELWALLSIVAPGLFPSPQRFENFYRKPIEKEADAEKLTQLRKRIRPLMLRRTKDQVIKELPPKIEQVVDIELDPAHRKIYDTYLQRERQRVLGLLGDMDKNRFAIFKSLTTLRMLSLSAALVEPEKYAHVPSAKLSKLLTDLEEIVAENHSVLIFSQFTSYLKQVREGLDGAQIPYLYLDGATKNRAALLKRFRQHEASVFVISLKAGGFGLNLTEADYCFLLDPWWNPAVEQQAIDRAHRIGQTKQVMVYRFVSKNTIEDKVMALKAKKSKLFSSILDEGAVFSSSITSSDIKSLLE